MQCVEVRRDGHALVAVHIRTWGGIATIIALGIIFLSAWRMLLRSVIQTAPHPAARRRSF